MARDSVGWVIAVDRYKSGQRMRYYVVFADVETAKSALKIQLGLPNDAVLEVKDSLLATDLAALKLRPGQIVKA